MEGRTNLFFDVFADLIIHLEFFLQFVELLFLDVAVVDSILVGWHGWREKVKEGLGWAGLADQAGAIRVWQHANRRSA